MIGATVIETTEPVADQAAADSGTAGAVDAANVAAASAVTSTGTSKPSCSSVADAAKAVRSLGAISEGGSGLGLQQGHRAEHRELADRDHHIGGRAVQREVHSS